NIPSKKNNWRGQNTSGFVHEEISRLSHRISATLDKKERTRLFRREQALWREELPAIPLYFHTEVSVTNPKFRGWKPTGTNTPVTWNAEQWSFAK
ncbi:MAG: peptide ABC transporter substrate-binding protein, partial [Nitrospinota bacterium]|nr:peptide ABC transporter substrate-binding protein [Nitrospinota bacterium]